MGALVVQNESCVRSGCWESTWVHGRSPNPTILGLATSLFRSDILCTSGNFDCFQSSICLRHKRREINFLESDPRQNGALCFYCDLRCQECPYKSKRQCNWMGVSHFSRQGINDSFVYGTQGMLYLGMYRETHLPEWLSANWRKMKRSLYQGYLMALWIGLLFRFQIWIFFFIRCMLIYTAIYVIWGYVAYNILALHWLHCYSEARVCSTKKLFRH